VSVQRKVPRAFSLHFGSGTVAEEATYAGPYHQPTIQLLDFSEGEAAGTVSLRFCSYNHRGMFQRDPLIVSEADIEPMREAIAKNPRLHALLKRLVDQAR
jgi:hypothetical protein